MTRARRRCLNGDAWARGRLVQHLDLPARPGGKWGLIYVYDSANELLIGGIVGGKAYGFDPRTRAWTMMALDAPGLTGLTFYCHDYIPDHIIHVMISAGNIYAFRWGNRVPAPSVPPSPPPPGSKATITIKGNDIGSLQQASGGLQRQSMNAQTIVQPQQYRATPRRCPCSPCLLRWPTRNPCRWCATKMWARTESA